MQSSYFLINGLRCRYLRWAPASPGRPVVLLHALGSNARIWEEAARQLAQEGLAPLAPDLRGHGLTDKEGLVYSLEALLRDLAAFVETANLEHPVLVGHSLGALLTLEYASRLPVGPRSPSGVVLVDGGLAQFKGSPVWDLLQAKIAPSRLDGISLVDLLTYLSATHQGWQPGDEDVQALLADYEVDEDEIASLRLLPEAQEQLLEDMLHYPAHSRFERLSCPVLAIPSRPPFPLDPSDQELLELTEQGIAAIRPQLPSLQVHWLEGCPTYLPLHHPTQLANLITAFAATLP
jgi:pimeloyl-ACP methyl ester carboxylesterase